MLKRLSRRYFLSSICKHRNRTDRQGYADIVDHATLNLLADCMTLAKAVRLSSGPEELMKFIG